MNDQTDQQLLRDYAERQSEASFTELVRRHVDLVYSAAIRMVGDPHLAGDVTQAVFVALAQNARQLKDHPVVSGWLHRAAQNTASKLVRTDVRRRAREQEAAVMNELLSAEPNIVWQNIAPHLDAALGELSEPDRDAVLLRYFERKSAREMAQILGISDEAAQKRVTRAVERLREFFTKRGVTVGAGGLAVVIFTTAVQAAPAGLAVTISTVALAGTTIATTATVTKAIAMTALQKTLIVATITAAVGTGIYQAHQAATLRSQVQTLQQQQKPLADQIQQLQRERGEAANRLVAATEEISRLKSADKLNELLKLRGEVGLLRQVLASVGAKSNSPAIGFSKMLSDPVMREYFHQTQLNTLRSQFGHLFRDLKLTPEQTERVVQAMGDLFMKNTGKMYAIPQGTLSAAEITQAASEREAELQRQLQPLLGENGYAQFTEFRKGFPADATVDLVNGQLGANQLTDAQNARLAQIVKAEPFDLTRGISGDWDPAFWGSPEDIDKHLQQVAESNQRIIQQSSGFLASDQLAALTAVLTNGVNERIAQAAALIQKQ